MLHYSGCSGFKTGIEFLTILPIINIIVITIVIIINNIINVIIIISFRMARGT